jgi:hypothetical protein
MSFPPNAWLEYQLHRQEIAGMLDARMYSIVWLDTQILSGDVLCFGTVDAVIAITVKQYPEGATELHGLVAAGLLSGILQLIEEAEQWGRDKGITFACIASRPGWEKLLEKRGYSRYQTMIRKDL